MEPSLVPQAPVRTFSHLAVVSTTSGAVVEGVEEVEVGVAEAVTPCWTSEM